MLVSYQIDAMTEISSTLYKHQRIWCEVLKMDYDYNNYWHFKISLAYSLATLLKSSLIGCSIGSSQYIVELHGTIMASIQWRLHLFPIVRYYYNINYVIWINEKSYPLLYGTKNICCGRAPFIAWNNDLPRSLIAGFPGLRLTTNGLTNPYRSLQMSYCLIYIHVRTCTCNWQSIN